MAAVIITLTIICAMLVLLAMGYHMPECKVPNEQSMIALPLLLG